MNTTVSLDVASAAQVVRSEILSRTYDSGFIVTRTPLRISFAGGGTDFAEFYERDYGAVFSTAINKYVYVTVKRHSELFLEPIRINYSKTEEVNYIHEINNDIARECLQFLEIAPPIYVSTVADVPASTGLGGSSSFAVGLLQALHALKGERVSAAQLAEEATYIEIDVLKQPIGKQDQYAAAFGGLNLFRFSPGGGVTVHPQRIPKSKLDSIFEYIMLFWTGMQRDSSSVLTEQIRNTASKLECLNQMRADAHRLEAMVSNGGIDPAKFGRILHESWCLKRGLASTITSVELDHWYELGMKAGAEGGKICGAGGGGFLLLVVRPEQRAAVRSALTGLGEMTIKPEVYGSRVLLTSMQ
jgi:D-glycero-alpha-D-manno-heptose-7-phosphate kinase